MTHTRIVIFLNIWENCCLWYATCNAMNRSPRATSTHRNLWLLTRSYCWNLQQQRAEKSTACLPVCNCVSSMCISVWQISSSSLSAGALDVINALGTLWYRPVIRSRDTVNQSDDGDWWTELHRCRHRGPPTYTPTTHERSGWTWWKTPRLVRGTSRSGQWVDHTSFVKQQRPDKSLYTKAHEAITLL